MSNKNPFAAALSAAGGNKSSRTFTEALGNTSSGAGSFNPSNNSQFNESGNFNSDIIDQFGGTNGAFQNFGQDFGQGGLGQYGNSEFSQFAKQQEELKKKEYEQKKLELHKRINPVDATELFNAKEEAAKKKIDQIKKDLRNLAKEIKKLNKQIGIVLMGRTTSAGLDGTGDENFFDKLRAFIILLTQKVRSARTWAQQADAKKKKAAKRGAKGLGKQMSESSGYEQRANMDQFFNSERGDNFGE